MGTPYETDIVAWANEQAVLLRSGQLSAIDIENIAEKILDVGKSEQHELANRMVLLLAHLLKWKFQPERQGKSWKNTINHQRERIHRRLGKMPSLKTALEDEEWWADVWSDAVDMAERETDLDIFPETCPWTIADILTDGWFAA